MTENETTDMMPPDALPRRNSSGTVLRANASNALKWRRKFVIDGAQERGRGRGWECKEAPQLAKEPDVERIYMPWVDHKFMHE